MTGLALALATTALIADERTTAKRFELARRSEPELIAFLRGMPKGADLHNHVTGAIYSDYILDNAIRQKLYYDTRSGSFVGEGGADRVAASELLSNDNLLYKYLNQVSMRGWTPNTVIGHDHFFDTFDIIGSGNVGLSTEDLLAEVLRRNMAQNVQYLELMTACAPWSELSKVVSNPPAIDNFVEALAILQPKLNDLAKITKSYMDSRDASLMKSLALSESPGGTAGPISARYIMQLNRLGTNEQFFASAAAAMTLIRSDRRVVALNIVASEDHPNARNNFEMQMRILNYLWRKFGQPNISLHAGELTLKFSPMEPMLNRIRKSIEIGRAKRIGHGISIAWEDNLPELIAKMKREGILVEVCLSSNRSILEVSGASHPILLYRRAGVPVNLNTDDEGVSRSNLTMEWVRAVRTYGFSYADMKEMARNSVEYSFLPGQSLYVGRDFRKLRPSLAGCRRWNWNPDQAAQRLLETSEKMRVQLRLEREFVKFEGK